MHRISSVRRIILAQISSSSIEPKSHTVKPMSVRAHAHTHARIHAQTRTEQVSSLSARRGPISHSQRRGEKRMKNFPPTNFLYNTRLRFCFSPEIPEIIDATGVMNLIYHAVLLTGCYKDAIRSRPTDPELCLLTLFSVPQNNFIDFTRQELCLY